MLKTRKGKPGNIIWFTRKKTNNETENCLLSFPEVNEGN